MCSVSTGIYLWGEEAGMEKGLERGLLQGEANGRTKEAIKNLRNLMASLNCNLETAFQYLGIPAEEQQEYEVLLEQHA